MNLNLNSFFVLYVSARWRHQITDDAKMLMPQPHCFNTQSCTQVKPMSTSSQMCWYQEAIPVGEPLITALQTSRNSISPHQSSALISQKVRKFQLHQSVCIRPSSSSESSLAGCKGQGNGHPYWCEFCPLEYPSPILQGPCCHCDPFFAWLEDIEKAEVKGQQFWCYEWFLVVPWSILPWRIVLIGLKSMLFVCIPWF